MFTGLVECMAEIKSFRQERGLRALRLAVPLDLSDSRIGDSFCVSGACLTAVEVGVRSLTVELSEETLRRTTLGGLGVGRRVNLERALRLTDRLGGHLVTGHVDGIGVVLSRRSEGPNVRLEIQADSRVSRYLVEKGSICVDGVSLTLGECGGDRFSVYLVPHTLQGTTLQYLKVGDPVNLEADLIGKYVEKLLGFAQTGEQRTKAGGFGLDFLARHGFAVPDKD